MLGLRLSWCPLLLVAAVTLAHEPVTVRASTHDLEYQVKAAFLFNFLKYVEWPEGALSATEPLRLCVLGTDPFGAILDDTVAGRTVEGHTLEVRRISTPGRTVAHCHLAYLGKTESRRYNAWLKSIGRKPILTVGETTQFIQHGGVIAFSIIDGKVRFNVGKSSLAQAGLSLSSRILALARKVE